LLKESLPFGAVSVAVLVILTLATKFGASAADWLDLEGRSRIGFVVAMNFTANCVTFLLRFAFFHYVLFAKPDAGVRATTCPP
jgi:hypothetical protein